MEIVCPKCGNKGKVKVIKQKKTQNTYKYVVIDHGNTKHSIDKELMVEIIERLLEENWELKIRIGRLEGENNDLKERISKLETEKTKLETEAKLYEEMIKHSIIIRYNNINDLEKLKKMMESKDIYMLRVIAYKMKTEVEYVDIK